jgi:riboflavin kinase / FMN adenylyltransferase
LLKTYPSVNSFEQVPGAVVTIGTFDGVHAGHRKLIDRLCEIAAGVNGKVVVLTFHPHPRAVLHNSSDPVKLLTTPREKAALLEKAGVDILVIQPFDDEFANVSAGSFIREILCNKLKTSVLVVGYDHRFGKNREGGFADLEAAAGPMGFVIERIPEQIFSDITVSSTKIRKALLNGDLITANTLLGYPYTFTGTVIHGNKLGRTLGFPTANLRPESEDKLIPAEGVYVVNVMVGGSKKQGLLSIGRRPTVDNSGVLSIEVYLLDFNEDIYGETLEVILLARIRGDRKFGSLESLVDQMKLDLQFARLFFSGQ